MGNPFCDMRHRHSVDFLGNRDGGCFAVIFRDAHFAILYDVAKALGLVRLLLFRYGGATNQQAQQHGRQ